MFTKLNDTTYKQVIKDSFEDRLEIEVGDSKQPDFKPQLKIMRWDKEVNLSIRAKEEIGAKLKELPDGTIVYEAKDYEVHQYDKPDASEEGGFEFEWVLKKKPITNILIATIQSKGLDFFYQPALTSEEIAKGGQRPENIVGSYAVYHSTKSNHKVGDKNYKAGKAFHIYRPKAIDANGVEVWCDLSIDGGILTITISQKFLDDAAYPIICDPTFGYTTLGASLIGAKNTIFAEIGAPADGNGTVDSISLGIEIGSYTSGTNNWKAALYNLISTSNADTKIGETNQNSHTANFTKAFETFTFATPPSVVNGTSYFLCGWSNSAATFIAKQAYDAGDASEFGFVNVTYGAWPSPITGENNDTQKNSVYATYTASGGGVVTTAQKHTLAFMGVG